MRRGHLTNLKSEETFDITTDAQGLASLKLLPDIYEIVVPGVEKPTALLMLHGRSKTVTLSPPN